MSFQINASYSEQIHFEVDSTSIIYGYLLEAIHAMGWSRGTITQDSITAYAGLSICSFGEVIHMQIDHNIVEITSTCLMPQFWSIGKNKRNIRRLSRRINDLIDSQSELHLKHNYMVASAEYVANEAMAGSNKIVRFNITGSSDKFSGFLSFFYPKSGYFITPILINLNIFIFLLIGLAGAGFWSYNLHGFEYLGANVADLTLGRGQWWRLITCQFMHAGFLHLIGNIFVLLIVGVYLEAILGRARFLAFYIISGVVGGLLGLYVHPFSYSVGASGAIFGMYGVFMGLLTSDLIEKHARKAIFSTLIFFIGFQLLTGINGQVDNSAHIGGVITGLLLGKVSIVALKADNSWRTIKRLSAIIAVSILLFSLCLMKMPNQADRFRKAITQFSLNESMALSYMDHFDGSLNDHILQFKIRNIQYQSLGFWKQNAAILDRLDELTIGKSGHAKVQLLRNYIYMQVQKARFELLWMIHHGKIDYYLDSIQSCNSRIEDMQRVLMNIPWTFR